MGTFLDAVNLNPNLVSNLFLLLKELKKSYNNIDWLIDWMIDCKFKNFSEVASSGDI